MSGDLGSLIIFRSYVLNRWLDGQHACVDCLSVDVPVEGGWSWAGSSSGGLYPYHVCICRSFPWVCSVSSEKSLWVFSLEYACLSSFLETEWEKGSGSLPLSFRVSIFSVLYSILTFYSAWGADPSSPVGTSCFLQEEARCDPTAQWDLCFHAVSTSPCCVQLCLPCPSNLPTSYPEALCRHQAFSLPVLPCGSPLLPAFQKCAEVLSLLPCLPLFA